MTKNKENSIIASALIRIERTIFLIASLAAIFGVWVYFSEIEDRALDSQVKRAQLLATCLTLAGPHGPISQLILTPPKKVTDPNYVSYLSKETVARFEDTCKEIQMTEELVTQPRV